MPQIYATQGAEQTSKLVMSKPVAVKADLWF